MPKFKMLKRRDANPYTSRRGRWVKPVLCIPFLVAGYFAYRLSFHTNPLTFLDLGMKPNVETLLTEDYEFHLSMHPKDRNDRFPSVDKRLKIYMSNWYQPPCITDDIDERIGYSYDFGVFPQVALNDRQDQVMIAILDTSYNTQVPVVLFENALKECKTPDCQAGQRMLFDICEKNFHDQFSAVSLTGKKDWLPVNMYFGRGLLEDMDIIYPFFASHRYSVNEKKSIKKAVKAVDCSNRAQRQIKNRLETLSNEKVMSPIIWDIHDMKKQALTSLETDSSWGSKINKAIWRGKLSGDIQGETFDERCASNLRCTLVLKAAFLSTVDVGGTQQRTDLTLDKSLHLIKSPMTIEGQLKYKIIIVAEGDGYATTLPWALYSNSVVIMPKPTKTSYLMEERLEPWIHYIPCNSDFLDLDKKIKWVFKNGEKAKRISERGTLWIHDLYMSKQAQMDNDIISREIVSRYLKFYVNDNA